MQSEHNSYLPEREFCSFFVALILGQALGIVFFVLYSKESDAILATQFNVLFSLLMAPIAYFYFCMRSSSSQANQARLLEEGAMPTSAEREDVEEPLLA